MVKCCNTMTRQYSAAGSMAPSDITPLAPSPAFADCAHTSAAISVINSECADRTRGVREIAHRTRGAGCIANRKAGIKEYADRTRGMSEIAHRTRGVGCFAKRKQV